LGTSVISNLFGSLVELRKATVSFVIYVRPSVCVSIRSSVRMEQLGTHWTDYHEIWYLNVFRKSDEKIQVSLNLTRIKGTSHED